MIDVLALGELLIDFAPHSVSETGYPTLTANPGGAPANFLAALAKYGFSTSFIGKVGDDMFGHLLAGTLESAGIHTDNLVISPDCFTTLAFVSLDETGNRDFSFARKPGADTCLMPDELNPQAFADCRVFHYGTLSLTDSPAREATMMAVQLARQNEVLISLDPNLRLPLWTSPEEAKAAIEWSLRHADIVKISDEEIDFLWGISAEEGAAKILEEFGASLVYATLGPAGCYAATRHAHTTTASPSGIHPIDTTGAGDIFGGSAMSQFLSIGKKPDDLTAEELHQIISFACTAASLSTEKHGGITSVPEKCDVLSVMEANRG